MSPGHVTGEYLTGFPVRTGLNVFLVETYKESLNDKREDFLLKLSELYCHQTV